MIIPLLLLGLIMLNFVPLGVRMWHEPRALAFAALFVVQISIGTLFFHLQEGWRWIDALYFSVITLATVGFGDLTPATDLGKLFTIVYLITGVGIVAGFIAFLARQNPVVRHYIRPGVIKFSQQAMDAGATGSDRDPDPGDFTESYNDASSDDEPGPDDIQGPI